MVPHKAYTRHLLCFKLFFCGKMNKEISVPNFLKSIRTVAINVCQSTLECILKNLRGDLKRLILEICDLDDVIANIKQFIFEN